MSLGQIVADIYEAQGLAFVEASATFLTNELLPLVKKTVTDTKVRGVQKENILDEQYSHFTKFSCLSGAHFFLSNLGAAEEVSRV